MKYLLGVCFLLFCLLFFRFFFYLQDFEALQSDKEISIYTRVASIPQVRGGIKTFRVFSPDGQMVFVTTSRFTPVEYGQRIRVKGTVKPISERFFTPVSMRYPKIYTFSRVGLMDRFCNLTAAVQKYVIDFFASVFSPTQAGLMIGLVLGIAYGLPKTFSDSLSSAGLTHIVAASGMNVSLITGFVFAFLSQFFRRKVSIVISFVFILFYMFLAGLEPSIVRATVMAFFAFSAALLGRAYFGVLALFLTGFILLFINPAYLFQIGFQLSFLSTLGILIFSPLSRYVTVLTTKDAEVEQEIGFWRKIIVSIFSDFKITFSAQIASLPILLFQFGSYNLLSIISNIFVLWTIPPLTISAFLVLIVSAISFPIAAFFSYVLLPILLYFEILVLFFGQNVFSVSVEDFSVSFMILYYFLVGVLLVILRIVREEGYMKRKSEQL